MAHYKPHRHWKIRIFQIQNGWYRRPLVKNFKTIKMPYPATAPAITLKFSMTWNLKFFKSKMVDSCDNLTTVDRRYLKISENKNPISPQLFKLSQRNLASVPRPPPRPCSTVLSLGLWPRYRGRGKRSLTLLLILNIICTIMWQNVGFLWCLECYSR